MFEIKFKNFNFKDFMDFVLSLADRHGLGQVKFYPERKEFFDDYQLSHISPTRDEDDPRGFTWAWSKKQNEVRIVNFSQFSKDEKRRVNITIDLDKSTIKLNEAINISSIIIEELAKKRFIHNKKIENTSDENILTLKPGFWGVSVDLKALYRRIRNNNKRKDKLPTIQKKQDENSKDISLWLKYAVALVTIFGFGWGIYVYLNPKKQIVVNTVKSNNGINVEKEDIATSTPDISELFSKALSLGTLMERQDFLSKYIGDQVYGRGVVKQISRLGNGALVLDIKVEGSTVSCIQTSNEENEKQLILLQDKMINFYGIFTYQGIFDHGMEIGNCVLEN